MNLVTDTETKLLIIPTKDTENIEIMEKEAEVSEMVCLFSIFLGISVAMVHSVLLRLRFEYRKR